MDFKNILSVYKDGKDKIELLEQIDRYIDIHSAKEDTVLFMMDIFENEEEEYSKWFFNFLQSVDFDRCPLEEWQNVDFNKRTLDEWVEFIKNGAVFTVNLYFDIDSDSREFKKLSFKDYTVYDLTKPAFLHYMLMDRLDTEDIRSVEVFELLVYGDWYYNKVLEKYFDVLYLDRDFVVCGSANGKEVERLEMFLTGTARG